MSLLGDVRDVAVDHGLWWPAGDPGRLRHLAEDWRRRARRFESAADAIRHEARAVAAGNAGAAVDAFLTHACLVAAELDHHADRCLDAARTLDERAEQIDAARRHIEAIAAELAAIVVTGALLTMFTGGLSDAAAASLTAGLMADAAALGIACTEAAAATVARVAVFATLGAWDGMLSSVVGQSTRHTVEQRELRWDVDLHEVEVAGAFGGVFGGTLGYLTRAPGPLPPVPKVGPTSMGEVRAELEGLARGRQPHVRLVSSEEELDAVFRRLTARGRAVESGYPGRQLELPDGTLVGRRPTSSSGGATIDIRGSVGTRRIKVHIR